MSDGFKGMIIGFLVMGLFAVSLITYGSMLAANNNPNQTIANDPSLSAYLTSVNSSLHESADQYNDSLSAISDSPTTVAGDSFIFNAIAGVWKNMKTLPILIYNSTIGLLGAKLGSSSLALVFGVIASVITIMIIFGVVYWLRQGSGEGS